MARPAPTIRDRLIGARIAGRRKELGLSQVKLAASIGVSYQSLQKWEIGETIVSGRRFEQLSSALNVHPSYFLDAIPQTGSQPPRAKAFAASGEGQKLLHLFERVQNPKTRHRLLAIVEAIVEELEVRSDGRNGPDNAS